MLSLLRKGLFTRVAARALASQSRCGNHRLESRVRENRMHGSEGGEGASPSRPLSPFRQVSSPHSDSPAACGGFLALRVGAARRLYPACLEGSSALCYHWARG